MIKVLMTRWRQKHRTIKFPDGPAPALPERFRGRPLIDPAKCVRNCGRCGEVCPTGALRCGDAAGLDLGKCLFCGACAAACPGGGILFTQDYRMAARRREDLNCDGSPYRLVEALEERSRRLFGRSLKLRQVCAGGCNACEADINVLSTVGWDLGRFGVQFVASPRHADGLLITGPVPENMRLALQKTYDAVAEPKLVIAVGSCAIAGGPFIGHPEVHNGAVGTIKGEGGAAVPIDLFIPGCPPHPLTILDGLLRLLGRIDAE